MLRSTPVLLVLALAACGNQATQATTAGGASGGDAPAVAAPSAYDRLKDPSAPELNATAPAVFRTRFSTNEGDFVVEVHREWAPQGADRFYNLVKNGYYDGVRFFRVIRGFMAQFGIHGDPRVSAVWRKMQIADDPVVKSNARGFVTYAMAGPNTRTTQLFINLVDNASQLDSQGFAPFGQVVEGMAVVDKLYYGYGEGAPRGAGPAQGRLQTEGNPYLQAEFPELDYIEKAVIEK